MKNLKRMITLLLVSVLLVTPFAAIPTYAEEREEKAFWHFAVTNFKCGVQVENVAIDEYYEEALGATYDYETLYDTWEAHLETEDGKIASGQIEPFVVYYLVISIDGLSSQASKYSSLISCANVSSPAYYYQDESCAIAKFRLGMRVDTIEEPIVINIDGYEIGADPHKVSITCQNKYIGLSDEEMFFAPTNDLNDASIREGVEYTFASYLYVAGTFDNSPESLKFTIKGLSEEVMGEAQKSGASGNIYYAQIDLPILGEPLTEIKEFGFRIEGYENGNTASQVLLKSEAENITVGSDFKLSHTWNSTLEADDIIELGKRYTLRGEFSIPKGCDVLLKNLPNTSYFLIPGVSLNGEELMVEGKRSRDRYETFTITVTLPILYIDGDVDFDGVCSVADALSLLRIAAKIAYEQEHTLTVGDLDGDGEITVSDALAVLRLAAKLS